MNTDEQQPTAASGSVPNAFGNALSWRWTRAMSTYLRRSGLPLLLCQLRNLANASGEIAFAADRRAIRISDIASAACCSVKDCRRYLEAAIRAGVVTTRGERKKGTTARYVILVSPFPDWDAAEEYLRSTARTSGKKPAPWTDPRKGHRDPNEKGSPRPQLDPETAQTEGVTATPTSKGHRDPNGWGHRDPNIPGFFQELPQEMAEVGDQPQVDGPSAEPPEPDQHHEEHHASLPPEPSGISRCPCGIPLLRPTPDGLCHGCRNHQATA
ncbi:hypothetical protein [Streptomyces sp. UH6]|uniref:hypothetical protein n=1 Tax=Streptomyces sp. UH6 TaxID=2748379 RepID=UPI0015D4F116|nr:hypothetical protein [Streptomyces sp. UH6]NYV72956.1 hypothetical protein [Streptomyces sp. UH6]